MAVRREHAGLHVGELRPDQDAFDGRCVERAHDKVVVAGAALPVLLLGSLVLAADARRARRRRGTLPANYAVSS